ncbi:hypothetical protein [Paenibacillus validus]|uniref:hypothetical protein n=1 Tax=Paenibacillus validus TaxID=44253 RepID=UPI003D2C7CB8
MSNKKSLLYGLGSGMIAGSVLLQLMSFAPAANQGLSKEDLQQPAAETMTREQIKEKASVYFNVYEKDVKVYLQPQVDALVQQRCERRAGERESQTGRTCPRSLYQRNQRPCALASFGLAVSERGHCR